MLLSSLRASLASHSNQVDLSKVPFAIPGKVQLTTRVDIIGQRAITPNLFRTYETLIFSCLDNNTLSRVSIWHHERPRMPNTHIYAPGGTLLCDPTECTTVYDDVRITRDTLLYHTP